MALLNQLTAITVQNIKQPGWHADGGGLYLEVSETGAKRWVLRIAAGGRRRDFGLGPVHKVSLKQARERAGEYRSKLYEGIDPTLEKKQRLAAAKPVPKSPSLETCAHEVHRLRKAQMKNARRKVQWIRQLEQYAFPLIGTKPVSDVTTADILSVLSPIWTAKPETAKRVRQRLYNILDWARASGHRSGDNPVDLIGEALPKQRKSRKHLAALPYAEVAGFIADLKAGQADPMTKLALEFMILTAARTIEVRFARRDEINASRTLWTIPGDDAETGRGMKMGREHIVPLSPRAAEIIGQALALAPESALLFPDRLSGQPMSENRFLNARDALGYKRRCTPHGFRSAFRDWVAEETLFPPEVAEMALAHAIKDEAEAAYRRGKLLAKRAELMEAWADFVAAPHPDSAHDDAAVRHQERSQSLDV